MNFKTWMQEHYDYEELYTITEQGCISGCAGGLIYYQETGAVYDQFSEELHNMLEDYKDNVGEWPSYVLKNLGNVDCFKNAVVWFCAEVVALELTQETEVN